MDSLYNRQEALNLTPVPAATIIGCGGTGSWVAIFLAMSGCENLFLFDFDHIEESNLNRLPFKPDCIGLPKHEALKDYILAIRPDCHVELSGRSNPFSLACSEGVLFDCTDAQRTQQELHKWAKENDRQYIRCGYNGTHLTVTDRTSSWHVGEEITGYTVVPSWSVPAAMAAALAVAKAMYTPELDVVKDIKELGGKSEKTNGEPSTIQDRKTTKFDDYIPFTTYYTFADEYPIARPRNPANVAHEMLENRPAPCEVVRNGGQRHQRNHPAPTTR